MGRRVEAPEVESLAALLAPYADPDPDLASVGRLVDVPPAVAAAAPEYLSADARGARPNGTQPAMTWLAAQAAELDGRLVGSLVPGRVLVRFDSIQLGHERGVRTGPADRRRGARGAEGRGRRSLVQLEGRTADVDRRRHRPARRRAACRCGRRGPVAGLSSRSPPGSQDRG